MSMGDGTVKLVPVYCRPKARLSKSLLILAIVTTTLLHCSNRHGHRSVLLCYALPSDSDSSTTTFIAGEGGGWSTTDSEDSGNGGGSIPIAPEDKERIEEKTTKDEDDDESTRPIKFSFINSELEKNVHETNRHDKKKLEEETTARRPKITPFRYQDINPKTLQEAKRYYNLHQRQKHQQRGGEERMATSEAVAAGRKMGILSTKHSRTAYKTDGHDKGTGGKHYSRQDDNSPSSFTYLMPRSRWKDIPLPPSLKQILSSGGLAESSDGHNIMNNDDDNDDLGDDDEDDEKKEARFYRLRKAIIPRHNLLRLLCPHRRDSTATPPNEERDDNVGIGGLPLGSSNVGATEAATVAASAAAASAPSGGVVLDTTQTCIQTTLTSSSHHESCDATKDAVGSKRSIILPSKSKLKIQKRKTEERQHQSRLDAARQYVLEMANIASSYTTVAGLSESATVAAAAMAAAMAAEHQHEVTKEDEGTMLPSSSTSSGGVGCGVGSGNGGAVLLEGEGEGGGTGCTPTIPPASVIMQRVMNGVVAEEEYTSSSKSKMWMAEQINRGPYDRDPGSREGKRNGMDYGQDHDMETIDGARLISASFGLLSNSLGLVADVVRIAGDTVGGVTGSSAKIVGTVMKGVGSGLDAAGSLIGGDDLLGDLDGGSSGESASGFSGTSSKPPPRRRKSLTSERLLGYKDSAYGAKGGDLMGNARHVAGQSVRLMGSVVRGFGDSLLLAGAATETIASSTASLAEDTVRVMEDFAGSIALAFMLEQKNEDKDRVVLSHHEGRPAYEHEHSAEFDGDASTAPSVVSFGSYIEEEPSRDFREETPSLSYRLRGSGHDSFVKNFYSQIRSSAVDFIAFAMADTEGVPSLAPELFVVMFCCYLAALLFFRKSSPTEKQHASVPRTRGSESGDLDNKSSRSSNRPQISNVDLVPEDPDEGQHRDSSYTTHESETSSQASVSTVDTSLSFSLSHLGKSKRALENQLEQQFGAMDVAAGVIRKVARMARLLLLIPWVVVKFALRFGIRIVFDRRMALFVIFCVAWVYLSRVSQMRSIAIQRHSEVSGFRSALESLDNSSSSVQESVAWLNALATRMWRVSFDLSSSEGNRTLVELLEYPDFVLAAMSDVIGRLSKCECRQPASPVDQDIACGCSSAILYGGLEPYISSFVGSLLIDALESSDESRPSDLAYFSLDSFTLGTSPPLIRGVELRRIQENPRTVKYKVDLDVLLGDLSMILEIKLSSLYYALLPSTKLAIHAIDARLPLELSVSVMPIFPYISTLNVSLSEAPGCRFRITPLSDNSGLRGVDLGSLPVINTWVSDVVRATLSEYVTPRYISINVDLFFSKSQSRNEATTSSQGISRSGERSGALILDLLTELEINKNLSGLPQSTSAAHDAANALTKDVVPRHYSSTGYKALPVDKHSELSRNANKARPSLKTTKKRVASSLNAALGPILMQNN